MAEESKKHTAYRGTYFDKDSTLKLARFAGILGWLIIAGYLLEWGYTVWMSVYGSISSGYPVDKGYLLFSTLRPLQGAMLLIVLKAVSKVLLILLDIEDNTRRSNR